MEPFWFAGPTLPNFFFLLGQYRHIDVAGWDYAFETGTACYVDTQSDLEKRTEVFHRFLYTVLIFRSSNKYINLWVESKEIHFEIEALKKEGEKDTSFPLL
jgi:hypothetical protein